MNTLARTTMFQAVAAVMFAAIFCPSAPADNGADKLRADEVTKLFKRWDRIDSPGVAVGIALDDTVIMARGFGIANLEHAIPISADTVFRIGSLAKQFTAASAAILIESEKLHLSDNIRIHIP